MSLLKRMWDNYKLNKDQLKAMAKSLLVAGGPGVYLLTKWLGIDSDTMNTYIALTTVGISMAGLIVVGNGTTEANLAKRAASMPGVSGITVDPATASPALIAAALEKEVPAVTKISLDPPSPSVP